MDAQIGEGIKAGETCKLRAANMRSALAAGSMVCSRWRLAYLGRMHCYSLLLGSRNTPSAGRRFAPRDDALVRSITAGHFPGGFTILNGFGAWYDASRRRFTSEESRQILICGGSLRAVRKWSRELAHALQQKELLILELGAVHRIRGD
jgi:hypothetical protein